MSPKLPPIEKKKGNSLILALLLPLALAATVGGAWVWKGRTPDAAQAKQSIKVHSVLHLDTFVLNLAGADERAYLRAGIDLGLRTSPKGKESENAPPVALLRDTILGVLSTARPDDLLTQPGKQALKANLLRALRERIPELEVEDVYFTEFLIQR